MFLPPLGKVRILGDGMASPSDGNLWCGVLCIDYTTGENGLFGCINPKRDGYDLPVGKGLDKV
jgi:hypothetical protein